MMTMHTHLDIAAPYIWAVEDDARRQGCCNAMLRIAIEGLARKCNHHIAVVHGSIRVAPEIATKLRRIA